MGQPHRRGAGAAASPLEEGWASLLRRPYFSKYGTATSIDELGFGPLPSLRRARPHPAPRSSRPPPSCGPCPTPPGLLTPSPFGVRIEARAVPRRGPLRGHSHQPVGRHLHRRRLRRHLEVRREARPQDQPRHPRTPRGAGRPARRAAPAGERRVPLRAHRRVPPGVLGQHHFP